MVVGNRQSPPALVAARRVPKLVHFVNGGSSVSCFICLSRLERCGLSSHLPSCFVFVKSVSITSTSSSPPPVFSESSANEVERARCPVNGPLWVSFFPRCPVRPHGPPPLYSQEEYHVRVSATEEYISHGPQARSHP
jgi:hypothetical protein